jgi:hypothetical protein
VISDFDIQTSDAQVTKMVGVSSHAYTTSHLHITSSTNNNGGGNGDGGIENADDGCGDESTEGGAAASSRSDPTGDEIEFHLAWFKANNVSFDGFRLVSLRILVYFAGFLSFFVLCVLCDPTGDEIEFHLAWFKTNNVKI